MTDSELVSEIYQTVNKLNDLIYEAAKGRKFSVEYHITRLQEFEMWSSYPHIDMRILTPVK
jgi:hypothetical protein